MEFLTILFMITLVLNGTVWLGIASLILYNLYQYTEDKHQMRKDIHPMFRKYVPKVFL